LLGLSGILIRGILKRQPYYAVDFPSPYQPVNEFWEFLNPKIHPCDISSKRMDIKRKLKKCNLTLGLMSPDLKG